MAEKKSLLLRLPPDLWADIKRYADSELRSVNAQIEYILREAVRKRAGKHQADKGQADEGQAGEVREGE